MMNKIWGVIILVSVVTAVFTGNTSSLSTGIIDSVGNAINLIITIGAMMCLWSGIMNIAQCSGLTQLLAKAFSPILSKLMPEYSGDAKAMGAVSMNITANLLGLGNAATPFGIAAMKEMSRLNNDKNTASNSMVMFVVLNTASIQIIPATVAALRRSAGSNEPMSILPYVWICSVCALAVGISMAFILSKINRED